MNVASIVSLILAIDIFRRDRRVPAYAVLLAIGNLHVLDLLIRGQIDAFVLLAMAVGWWAVLARRPLVLSMSLCVMAIKPMNVALPGLLFLFAIRHWPRRDILTVFSMPVVVLILSGFIAGADWPLRYMEYTREHPIPNRHRSITIWNVASLIGIPLWIIAIGGLFAVGAFLREAWQQGVTLWTLSLAVATNFAFTYYAGGYHYVLMIPALLLIGSRSQSLLLLAYLTTWTPLIRLGDNTLMHWDAIFPALIFITLWALAPRERGRTPAIRRRAPASADDRLARPKPV
jgi:hypothetical protein